MIHGRAVLLALALVACSGKPYVVSPERNEQEALSHRMFVASHGWHTGVIIPARPLNDLIPELMHRFGPVDYYEIGWGDQGFYQARKTTISLALRAIFWSEGAVLHVVAVPADPRAYFSGSEVLEFCISESELASLKAFLANSFVRGSSGRIAALSKGIYKDSQFYAGEGRYHLLNTSNKWTAKALKSSGLDISPTFKLTAGSIVSYLESNPRQCGRELNSAR